MNKTIITSFVTIILLLAGGYWFSSKADNPAPQNPPAATHVLDVAKAMEDRPLGNPNAPVTIIEYASMTCPHCANFNNRALPEVKKELIDTGKVRLIFRDFPFDRYAVKASMLSRCAPAEKYHDVVDTLFREQDKWTKNADPIKGLTEIGVSMGMSEGFIGACFGNTDLEEALLKSMQEAQATFLIQRTPTFFFKKDEEWLPKMPEFEDIVNRFPFEHKHENEH